MWLQAFQMEEPGNDKAEGARPPALKRQKGLAMLGGTLTQFSHQGVCVCGGVSLRQRLSCRGQWQVDGPGSFSKG